MSPDTSDENKEIHQSILARAQSEKSDCSLSFSHSWFSRGLGRKEKSKEEEKRTTREEKRKERNRKETMNKKLHPSAIRPSVGAVGIADD